MISTAVWGVIHGQWYGALVAEGSRFIIAVLLRCNFFPRLAELLQPEPALPFVEDQRRRANIVIAAASHADRSAEAIGAGDALGATL